MLMAILAPLLILAGNAEVVPVVVAGTTVDLFKVVGSLFAGSLTGYILFSALKGEQE